MSVPTTDLGLPVHADGLRAGSDLLDQLVAEVEDPSHRGWYRSHGPDDFEIAVSPELRQTFAERNPQ